MKNFSVTPVFPYQKQSRDLLLVQKDKMQPGCAVQLELESMKTAISR
jgi:hypothetical protein